jgi:hypothetical protein
MIKELIKKEEFFANCQMKKKETAKELLLDNFSKEF